MKQQCYMAFIYFSWTIYAAGLVFILSRGDYSFVGFWLVWLPLVMWIYVRSFPRISRLMGYGRVDDEPAGMAGSSTSTVTLYTALGCPFCPIVEERLTSLKKKMGFDLKKVDVTLKPNLLVEKGVKAVPVTEVEGRRLAGNATTKELVELIMGEGSVD